MSVFLLILLGRDFEVCFLVSPVIHVPQCLNLAMTLKTVGIELRVIQPHTEEFQSYV